VITPGASLARALKLNMPYSCASRETTRTPSAPFIRSISARPASSKSALRGL
jgi:hypothetical protein